MSSNDQIARLPFSGFRLAESASACVALEERVGELFARWREPLFRYLMVMLRDAGEAEDLTQECFLRLYVELQERRNITEIKAWLFRAGHNMAIDHYRKRESQGEGSVDISRLEIADARQPSSEESMLRDERLAQVRAAADRLPQQQRLCLHLRTEGFRYREIAEILRVSESTVCENIRRALVRLTRDLHA